MFKKIIVVTMLFFFVTSPVSAQTVRLKFEPFATLVKKDNQEYSGILLSEEEFGGIVEMKIKLGYFMHLSRTLDAQLSAKNKQLESTLAVFDNMTDKIETEIDDGSWWDENKGVMGIVIGLVVGVGLSVGVFYAAK